MAKTTVWNGSLQDGDWSGAGNWDNGLPVAGDTVIFDGAAADGSWDCDVNMAHAATNLARLDVTDGYSGTIGSSGAYLTISVDRCIYAGTGNIYLDSGGTDSINVLIVTGTGTAGHAYFKGDISTLYGYLGDITYTGGAGRTLTSTYFINTGSAASDLTFTATGSGGTITSLIVYSGTHTINHTISTGNAIYGGTVTYEDGAAAVATGSLSVHDGTVNWKATGTLTMLTAGGGSFDASGNMDAKTITNVHQYEGEVNLANGANNITVTNYYIRGTKSPTLDYVSKIAITYP